jgi:rhodanese-related sulfurtransferase
MIRKAIVSRFFLCILLALSSCGIGEKKEVTESSEIGVVTLDPHDFQSKLSEVSNPVLIDVRTPGELSEGMIDGAVNIDFKDPSFDEKISTLDKDKSYFLYCLSGKRSGDAAKQMDSAGFKHIYMLEGGFKNWNSEGLETVKP